MKMHLKLLHVPSLQLRMMNLHSRLWILCGNPCCTNYVFLPHLFFIVVFLIDEQNLTEDNFFQKTLAIEVTSIKKDRKYKKNIKDKAQKLLVSLCNREIDLCLSIVYDKSKEIEEVVEGALHGHRREMEYSEFRYLYRVINKWSNQFAESLRFYGVIDNTIDTLISDVTKVVKKHISNCVYKPCWFYL